ncbi:hypothetical protein CY34DRAFT_368928 [Suillus luteus UH-Slu-Lm8-n1]|uniref:Uncharacterized protein n=1 Tax=Suillus luteus UH-Slu-Lm8-n1 TaxID=930992 RepID=A0A0D0A982_9AGAM|nr:hypothetical protein CY34DRAFT_368928 [Suillus luteus UH-Slu-Lm8-n1]
MFTTDIVVSSRPIVYLAHLLLTGSIPPLASNFPAVLLSCLIVWSMYIRTLDSYLACQKILNVLGGKSRGCKTNRGCGVGRGQPGPALAS